VNIRTVFCVIQALFLTHFKASTLAQEVTIPDPGLNAAIREALQKPSGPLTEQDIFSLTNLNARNRNVSSIAGLESARNLVSLNLEINHLSSVSPLSALTNLSTLDLSINPLIDFSPPSVLTNLASLTIEGCGLTNLTLPATLIGLTNLDVEGNDLRSFNLPSNLTSLIALNLGFNSFTNFSLPGGLTNLDSFYFAGNPLTNVTLPPGLVGMTELNLSQNLLTHFTLPPGMTNLSELNLAFNQLTNLTLPADLRNLNELNLDFNRFTSLGLPTNLANLAFLHLRSNRFANLNLPTGLTGLIYLDLRENQLTNLTFPPDLHHLVSLSVANNKFTSFTLPMGLTNLTTLFLDGNQLTNVVLPLDLGHLESLDIGGNRLTSLNLPEGLTNLTGLFLVANQLTNLTLPPDMTKLSALSFLSNPLTTLVLSEPLAASTNLMVNLETIASLQNQGLSVFTYPLAVQLVRPQAFVGSFKLEITGPPGVCSVFGSTNFTTWIAVGVATNPLGSVNFHDVTANASPQKFYRVLLQVPPAKMVFIPPNTFTMGTPANEVNRQADEGPQTTVTISHGFWMGKYEVTQREYLAVVGSNPSQFPGNLDRPVETVSWLDATNYCALLTELELAAGRISPGSRYRLPTEAEWECAARAGTSTRFSYGDDPNFTDLANHAWYWFNSGFGTQPVGRKLPNPWGLHDLEGNVLEWTQDWYGPYPGGTATDPQGPASNIQGVKVIRGGAWDASEPDCRSGRRLTKGVHPFITDSILGFRVVLVTEP